jgi:hypothetical protein
MALETPKSTAARDQDSAFSMTNSTNQIVETQKSDSKFFAQFHPPMQG